MKNSNFNYNQRNKFATKKKTRDNKKIAGIILLVLFAFYTICSCLSIFTFVKSVSADSVSLLYTFNGSNHTIWARNSKYYTSQEWNVGEYVNVPYSSLELVPPEDIYIVNQCYPVWQSGNSVLNYRFDISDVLLNGEIHTDLVITSSYANYTYTELNVIPLNRDYYVEHDSGIANGYILPHYNNGPTENLIDLFLIYDGSSKVPSSLKDLVFSTLRVERSSIEFNCNIVRVDMGNRYISKFYSLTNNAGTTQLDYVDMRCNYLRYYDIDGHYIDFSFPIITSSAFAPQSLLTSRTYYLNAEVQDNVGYQNGYESGYLRGQKDGYNQGVEDGNKNGYKQGYADGKIDGVASANDYTFLSLIGSVVDAPIRALFGHVENGQFVQGLLSFEILGINLAGFLSGLLTIGLILAVIRFIL